MIAPAEEVPFKITAVEPVKSLVNVIALYTSDSSCSESGGSIPSKQACCNATLALIRFFGLYISSFETRSL